MYLVRVKRTSRNHTYLFLKAVLFLSIKIIININKVINMVSLQILVYINNKWYERVKVSVNEIFITNLLNRISERMKSKQTVRQYKNTLKTSIAVYTFTPENEIIDIIVE
jgi:hypothetical protein